VTITSAGGGLTIANNPVTHVTCPGGSDGSIVATCNGGTGPFTFAWNPTVTQTTSGNTSTATGLAAGTYVVTVTDANGCTGQQTFTITAPPAMAASFTQTNVLCNGNNTGSATITGSGGTGPYTFSWAPSATNTTTGNSNTGTGLTAQTYNVIVLDANGCSTSQAITITEPPLFVASAVSVATSCNQANGSVIVATQGGAGAPTYTWTPGNYTTATVTNLAAGTYVVVATDANGCTSSDTAVIAPSANMTVTQSSTDLLCYQDNSGTASITVTGNTGNVTYTWSPNVSTTDSATGLAAGTYIVDANDPNGCSTTSTIVITEPPQLTSTVGGFNVSCYGGCDGQIVVIPAGGTGTYTFAWSNSCNQPSCNNICAGTYNVVVTDQNGCTSGGSTTVTEPPQIVITTSFDTAHCGQTDGAAYANATGGTGSLTYNWIPSNTPGQSLPNVGGGNQQCVVTDASGCSDTATVNVFMQPGVVATMGTLTSVDCFGGNTGDATATFAGGNGPYTISWNTTPPQTSATATGLTAGSYVVTATDADGCTSTATAVITEPPQLTITASASPASVCAGQPVTVTGTATGGTAAYSMVWQPVNLPGASQTIIPQLSGTYTVDVTDANGCTASATTTITVNPIPSASFAGDSLSGCAPLCVNFSDLTTLSAGTITSWAWDFGDQTQATTQNPNHCYPISGLYTVSLTVTSNAGCANTIVMNNYVDVHPIPTAAFVAGPQPTTELNPQIYFTDMSVGAVTWDWSFGDLTQASSTLQNPSFYYPASGCYDVVLEVSSANGCTDITTEEVCIDPDVAIYVPNTFTPNDDGSNDLFFAQGIGIDPENFELWVFDRWGNLIFYTDDVNEGWNGKVQGGTDLCQIDTYVWKIRCLDMLDRKHNLIGHVNLIR
jgi:gliding motility-associated-like protein